MAAETGEDRFERLIRQAHERLPEPDTRRLVAMEVSLAGCLTTRRSNAWWWLAVALAVGGAAAGIGGWLVGDDENRVVAVPSEPAATQRSGVNAAPATARDQQAIPQAPKDSGRGAVIFRRE
jgi:hypothetical protein